MSIVLVQFNVMKKCIRRKPPNHLNDDKLSLIRCSCAHLEIPPANLLQTDLPKDGWMPDLLESKFYNRVVQKSRQTIFGGKFWQKMADFQKLVHLHCHQNVCNEAIMQDLVTL